jgi:plastocyanin
MLQHSRTGLVAPCFIIASLAGACGGGGDGGGGGVTPPPTTAIAKNSGDAQAGPVGQPLGSPLRVLVTESGTPSAGVTVSWSTSAAGGSVDPASGPTDADGIASTTWTLGTTPGSQSAQAALSGAAGTPVTFSATAAAGPAEALSKAAGDNQTGDINTALPTQLQAKVADGFGNGVAGVDVSWSAVGASVSSASVPTNGSGISPVTVTLGGTAGPVTITAAAAGLTAVTFNATAEVPPPLPTEAAVRVGQIFFASNRNGSQNPAVDTIAVGGTVTWTWVSSTQHSVESLGPPSFTSSVVKSNTGDTHTFTFTTAGAYPYDCSIHGSQMSGRIVVR